MKSILLLLVLALALTSFSQSSKVKIQKKKNWIESIDFDKEAKPSEGQGSSYYYLLIDEQENIPLQEDYIHNAYKILTSEGVQQMADLNFEFDPSYNELILHSIVIHRNEKTINQLTNNIRTIQREQSMDRYLYDGTLTAIVNLSDVRVGDIVEYSYTRKGYNPIYKGHFTKDIYLNFGIGYNTLYQKIILPSSLKPRLKYFNTELKPSIQTKENQTSYIWNEGSTNAVLIDSNVPDWYDPYQHIVITDLNDWKEVALWATNIFTINENEKKFIREKILPSINTSDTEDFIRKAIQFVQDEVRYLGFEEGLNSHKPHSPQKVYEQRFGDCKDKALLLASILESKGIEARPLLVNTLRKEKTDEQLPSLHAFNHCVTYFKHNDKKFFVDPTISNQGGKLSNYYFPNYGKGLIVDRSTVNLEEFPPLQTSTTTEVQDFDLTTIGGEAILSSRTTYTGSEADYQRSEFLRKNTDEIQKNYISFYSNQYPDISTFEPLSSIDNRNDNVFTVVEKYKIPTFWKPHQSADGVIYCEVYPQSLQNYFNISKSTQRIAPYRLSYPLDYYHTIHIKLPEDWTVEPKELIIDNSYYLYDYEVSYSGREIKIFTHYQTKKSYIPVEQFDKLVSDHEKMMDQLSFTLTYNKHLAKGSSNKWPGLLIIIITIGIGIWLTLRFYNYDPEPYFSDTSEPIGGWLILIGIGLLFTPFRLFFDFYKDPSLLGGDRLLPLLSDGQFGLFSYILLINIYNTLHIFFSILLLILFFKRRSSLPQFIVIYYAVNAVMALVDTIVSLSIDPSLSNSFSSYSDLIGSIFAASIWIPYFRMSVRVKETFVNRLG